MLNQKQIRSCRGQFSGPFVLLRMMTVCAAGVCFAMLASTTAAQPATQPVATLPAGTKVVSSNPNGRWNRLVLLATPKINSGDVDKLSESMRQAATQLALTIMATVKNKQSDNTYELDELAVGYSMPIAGQQVVITSETQSSLGADLGFIQRRVLSQNEARLAKLKIIVQTTKLIIFDAPSLMHRDGKHRDYVTRHMMWIDAKTGSSATLVWLLGKNAAGQLRPAIEPLRIVAAGTKEQRNVHVDGSAFTLGFPTERAFALEQLPPGQNVSWTKELATIAILPSYDAAQLARLSNAINAAIRAQ